MHGHFPYKEAEGDCLPNHGIGIFQFFFFFFRKYTHDWAREMAEQVKVLGTKPKNLVLLSGTRGGGRH